MNSSFKKVYNPYLYLIQVRQCVSLSHAVQAQLNANPSLLKSPSRVSHKGKCFKIHWIRMEWTLFQIYSGDIFKRNTIIPTFGSGKWGYDHRYSLLDTLTFKTNKLIYTPTNLISTFCRKQVHAVNVGGSHSS